jgi:4'-phosphopantetheinyl transferase
MNHSEQTWNIPRENVPLAINEVHVWRTSLEKPLNAIHHLQSTLSPKECERAERFHFAKDRRHWIVARGILRLLLGRYLNVAASELQFVINEYGKPALAHLPQGTHVHFNLSHSGELALFAFAYDRQVGIDVEYKRSDVDYEGIARISFSSIEQAVLRSLPNEVMQEAFYNCWTRKEAYIKALGKGLSHPLDQFDVSLTPGEPPALLADRLAPRAPALWSLSALAPGVHYAAALVVEGAGQQLTCWQWQE